MNTVLLIENSLKSSFALLNSKAFQAFFSDNDIIPEYLGIPFSLNKESFSGIVSTYCQHLVLLNTQSAYFNQFTVLPWGS